MSTTAKRDSPEAAVKDQPQQKTARTDAGKAGAAEEVKMEEAGQEEFIGTSGAGGATGAGTTAAAGGQQKEAPGATAASAIDVSGDAEMQQARELERVSRQCSAEKNRWLDRLCSSIPLTLCSPRCSVLCRSAARAAKSLDRPPSLEMRRECGRSMSSQATNNKQTRAGGARSATAALRLVAHVARLSCAPCALRYTQSERIKAQLPSLFSDYNHDEVAGFIVWLAQLPVAMHRPRATQTSGWKAAGEILTVQWSELSALKRSCVQAGFEDSLVLTVR